MRAGEPGGYWLDGVNSIVLDALPEEDYTYHLHLHQYTAWQKDEDDFEHWLLDNAEDMLLFTTLWYQGVFLRDSRMIKDYKELRDTAMQTLHIAEQEIQHNDRDAVMLWTPPFPEPDWTNSVDQE